MGRKRPIFLIFGDIVTVQGAVAINFDATRYGINLSTELDYLVSVCLNATAPWNSVVAEMRQATTK